MSKDHTFPDSASGTGPKSDSPAFTRRTVLAGAAAVAVASTAVSGAQAEKPVAAGELAGKTAYVPT